MPARSEAQRRLMGAALAAKRGKKPISKGIAKLAASMTEQQLRDFAKKRAMRTVSPVTPEAASLM